MIDVHNANINFFCQTRGHGNVISDASFSNDERILATASWDKNIQLWDVSSGTYR